MSMMLILVNKNMKYPKTLEKYQDIAGKWQVRVQISDNRSIFFKFQKKPTKTEIKTETLRFIKNQNRQSETERIDMEITKLKERKAQLNNKVISKPQA